MIPMATKGIRRGDIAGQLAKTPKQAIAKPATTTTISVRISIKGIVPLIELLRD